MPVTTQGEPDQWGSQDGSLTAAISDAMAKLMHEHAGRGPTESRTTLGKDLVVCVMSHALTKIEQTLVSHGKREAVLDTRRAVQETMRVDAIRAVHELTGRRVDAFLSANHIDPDLAVEIFVLGPLAEV